MLLGNLLNFDESTEFRSLRKNYAMVFSEVFQDILNFIMADVDCSYRISVGTDSQVGSKTVFVSCIHIHRIGKGAIGFLHKSEIPRRVKSLREKIYLETCASLQLAYLFDSMRISELCHAVSSSSTTQGVSFEFHIDIGSKGQTKTLISEMVGMVKCLNFEPKIKPDSYCASCFADRYTKAM